MTPLVPIALFGWPIVVICLFTLMKPARAVVFGMLGAWLFLPMAGYQVPGLPDITKMSVTCAGVFIGAAIYDSGRFTRLKFCGTDAIMAAWLLMPMVSAVASGYGPYEGATGILNQFVSWGMPYLIGRMYFSDLEGLRELATGMFIGGLVYCPFVLFESRFSPILHTYIYGFVQQSFEETRRYGGWRPTVFMQHGLAVAMFMGTSAVSGVWLWYAGKLRLKMPVPTWMPAIGVFVVALACKSTYALMLTVAGLGALFVSRWFKMRLVLAVMLMITPMYVAARTVGGWHAQELRDISDMMGEDRSGSLEVRLRSEDVCWAYMRQRSIFGDGRMDRLMLGGSPDSDQFIPDGFWLIVLTKNGIVGVMVIFGCLLFPTSRLLAKTKSGVLFGRDFSGAVVLATVLILYALDNLLNAMVDPIYLLGLGGLGGLSLRPMMNAARPRQAVGRRVPAPGSPRGAQPPRTMARPQQVSRHG